MKDKNMVEMVPNAGGESIKVLPYKVAEMERKGWKIKKEAVKNESAEAG